MLRGGFTTFSSCRVFSKPKLSFFPYKTITGDVDMNPPDANGMVLGSSMPISCKRLPERKLTSQLF